MTKKVLIAEDNLDAQKFIQTVLKTLLDHDVEFYAAENGSEAIDQLEREVPDLAILDIMMPNKSGFEVCEYIKQSTRFAHTYVIFLTAKTHHDDHVYAAVLGADEYITKPFDPAFLLERAAVALGITLE